MAYKVSEYEYDPTKPIREGDILVFYMYSKKGERRRRTGRVYVVRFGQGPWKLVEDDGESFICTWCSSDYSVEDRSIEAGWLNLYKMFGVKSFAELDDDDIDEIDWDGFNRYQVVSNTITVGVPSSAQVFKIKIRKRPDRYREVSKRATEVLSSL